MASILKKAQQQKKDQSKTKASTNLNVLNQQEVIEDKIIPQNSSASKKHEEDSEAIDLSNVKQEIKTEEKKSEDNQRIQNKVENVTWGDTKDMDEQEALNIVASQVQPAEKEDNKGKKIMKSWVPQKRDEYETNVVFNEDASDFVDLSVDALTKKTEKKPNTTFISRAEDPSSGSSSNPPRFTSNKGGFKQLELTEQQKKLLEIEEKNKKEYKTQGVPGNVQESNDLFGQSSGTAPPRFIGKKNDGGNFVQIQKSELDLKQEEAQRRAEERLKEMKNVSNTQITETTQQETSDDFKRPRFQNFKVGNSDNSKQENNEEKGQEEVSKPSFKFVNSNKTNQGPNFKPIEVKEMKTPDVLENKKYLTKQGEKSEENKKKSDRQPRQDQESGDEELDEGGFKIVKNDQYKTHKQRGYKEEQTINRSDKKKEGGNESELKH